MAKGESKVKKSQPRQTRPPPARNEISTKAPQNSSKNSGFQDISRRTFRKLLHPHGQEKAGPSISGESHPSMLPSSGNEPGSTARASQPRSRRVYTSGQCTRINDSQAGLKNEKDDLVPAKRSVTRDTSHRNKAVKDKAEPTAHPITMSLNDMNVYQYGQIEIASVLTSTRSALTQELLLSRGSNIAPELLFREVYDVRAEPEHSTLSGEERNDCIADLIDAWRVSEADGYTSSREMSLKLDKMASQITSNDNSFPRRSLTPSLGASTSFLQLPADSTFSATERSGLIRINVTAWIFISLSESRLDGLRCIFVVDLAMAIESALRRRGPALKPARLARLVEDYWFLEPSARDRTINEYAAPASAGRALSNRPVGSLPEPGSSTKSARSSADSMSSTSEDANTVNTKPAGAFEIVPEKQTNVIYPQGEQILNTVATQQQHGVYDYVKYFVVSTTVRLRDGAFEQMFSWFVPGPKQPAPTQDNFELLSQSAAAQFFVEGRVFDISSHKMSPPKSRRLTSSVPKALSGRPVATIYTYTRRFVVVKAKKGHCYAFPVYPSDTSNSKRTKRSEYRHPLVYDSRTCPQSTSAKDCADGEHIVVEMNPGETLAKGSRLNLNKLKSIEWTTKIKDVGRVIGEQSIKTLQSKFKSEVQTGEACDVDNRWGSQRAEANAEQIPESTNSSDDHEDYDFVSLSEAHQLENEPVATETVRLQTVSNIDLEQSYLSTIRSYYAKTTKVLYNLATIFSQN